MLSLGTSPDINTSILHDIVENHSIPVVIKHVDTLSNSALPND